MPCNNEFNVYSGAYLNGAGLATIITTFSSIPEPISLIDGESFVFIESIDEAIGSDKVKASIERPKDLQHDQIDEICDAFKGIMLDEGKSRGFKILYEKYKKEFPIQLASKLFDELAPVGQIGIVRLIIRNRFPKEIKDITHSTKSSSLSDFLKEKANTPKIVYNP